MEDNDKEDNDDKGISALEIDRDLGFSRGHFELQPFFKDIKDIKSMGIMMMTTRRMMTKWRTTTRTTMMTRVSQL